MDVKRDIARLTAAALLAGGAVGSAGGQIVTFPGSVSKSCTLTPVPGALAPNTAGTELGSEQSGGSAATLTVTATGGGPTVTFAAPTMSGKPGTYTRTPTVSLKFAAASGPTQDYTSAQSSYTGSAATLNDTVTINAKAVDANGFPAGSYSVTTTATCSQ